MFLHFIYKFFEWDNCLKMVRIFSAFQFFFVITEHIELGSVKNNTLPIQYVAEMGRIVKYYYLHDMNLLVFFLSKKILENGKLHQNIVPRFLLVYCFIMTCSLSFSFSIIILFWLFTIFHFYFVYYI